MINKILQVFASEVMRLTTYNSKRFFSSFEPVIRAGDALILNAREERYGGIADYKQSYGYIRLLEEKVLFSERNLSYTSCSNIKTQDVIIPVRVVIVSPRTDADTLYQGMLEVFSAIDFKYLGSQDKNYYKIHGIPFNINIIPKVYYPTTEKVAFIEDKENYKWSEDWTYVAFDLDLVYTPEFSLLCTVLCAECERIMPDQARVTFDFIGFETILSVELIDLANDIFCYPVTPNLWIFDNTLSIYENLSIWAGNINMESGADVIAEVQDNTRLVLTFTNPTNTCCGSFLNYRVNDSIVLTTQVNCN